MLNRSSTALWVEIVDIVGGVVLQVISISSLKLFFHTSQGIYLWKLDLAGSRGTGKYHFGCVGRKFEIIGA